MSLYIHINNLTFKLKIKLVIPCQLITLVILVILDKHLSPFR
jgi:hypothetical protein